MQLACPGYYALRDCVQNCLFLRHKVNDIVPIYEELAIPNLTLQNFES